MTRTEATCQGCHVCKWGGIKPCPSQSAWKQRELAREPEWLRRRREQGLPAKDMTVTA